MGADPGAQAAVSEGRARPALGERSASAPGPTPKPSAKPEKQGKHENRRDPGKIVHWRSGAPCSGARAGSTPAAPGKPGNLDFQEAATLRDCGKPRKDPTNNRAFAKDSRESAQAVVRGRPGGGPSAQAAVPQRLGRSPPKEKGPFSTLDPNPGIEHQAKAGRGRAQKRGAKGGGEQADQQTPRPTRKRPAPSGPGATRSRPTRGWTVPEGLRKRPCAEGCGPRGARKSGLRNRPLRPLGPHP